MNEVLIRFYIPSKDKIIELLLDTRISFKENFALVSKMLNQDFDYVVYDRDNKLFLSLDEPLSSFDFCWFKSLDLLC